MIRPVKTVLKVLLVAITWQAAICGAALAGQMPEAAALPAGSVEDISHQLEIREYAADFNVTTETAAEDLSLQDSVPGLVVHLRSDLGSHYAGVWFENSQGIFVVAVTGSTTTSQLNHAMESTNLLPANYTVLNTSHNWEELEATQMQLHQQLTTATPLIDEYESYIEPRTNDVVLAIAPTTPASAQENLANEPFIADRPIEIRTDYTQSDYRLTSCSRLYLSCTSPLRGGVLMENPYSECTAGFKAIGNTFHHPFILTAGHCLDLGGNPWKSYTEEGGKWVKAEIGEGGTFEDGPEDFGVIHVSNTKVWNVETWPSELVLWAPFNPSEEPPLNSEYSIGAEGASYLGLYVCHSGWRTGTTCGNVDKMNVELYDKAFNLHYYHLTEVENVCVNNGDSGGPVYANHVAYGLVNGTRGGEVCGTHMTYQEVISAANALEVTVAETRYGGQVVAETLPPTEVQGRSATFRGTVDSNGTLSNYHFEYGAGSISEHTTSLFAAGSEWSPIEVSKSISLTPSTTYQYRLKAENLYGESVGEITYFTTPKTTPLVAMTSSTSTPGKATLDGTVEPGGAATSYSFEWGTTESYGHVSSGEVGEGTSNVPVEAVAEVKGQTTYYDRLIAHNYLGYSNEVKGSFTTPDWRPSVTAPEATEVGPHKYTLHAKINPEGFGTHYRYEWGTSESYGSKYEASGELTGTSEIAVSHEITELEDETTYDYRVIAENSEGSHEAKGTFTTPAWRPTVTLEAPAEIVETEATLHGTVNPHGRASEYWFEYGTTEAYGFKAPIPNGSAGSGTTAKAVEAVISGLKGETKYHYRLVAQNEAGVRYGKDEAFTTTHGQPIVATEGATVHPSLEPTEEITFAGKVDPDANSTKYWFEYGTTEALGSKVPASPAEAGSGKSSKSVEATATGIAHRTTYYYRIAAENVKATEKGSIQTVSTKVIPEWAKQSPIWYVGSTKLLGVSCITSTECMSVGEYKSGASKYLFPYSQRWHNGEWTIKEPLSESTTAVGLWGVNCISTGTCEAVGRAVGESGNNIPIAYYWNKTEWKSQSTPNPGLGGALTGVSCTSATECTAVGYYQSSATETKTVAMRWNGTKWETQTTPNVSGAKLTELTGVSCTNFYVAGVLTKECIASGYAKNFVGVYEAIAERWNGKEWTLNTLPKPEETLKASYLLGVSCDGSTECVGVGYYENSSKVDVALVEKWGGYYGSTWSVQGTPKREGAKLTKLNGISCLSGVLKCEAVGEFETSTEIHRTIAAFYEGGLWTVQYSPNGEEGSVKPSDLAGVSCTELAKCSAVGYWESFTSEFGPLAERFE